MYDKTYIRLAYVLSRTGFFDTAIVPDGIEHRLIFDAIKWGIQIIQSRFVDIDWLIMW